MEKRKDKDRSFSSPSLSPANAEISRRRFFTRITAFIAGGIALAMSVPLVGYLLSPALRRTEHEWVQVGSVADLPPLEPRELSYMTTRRDGWMTSTVARSVWGLKQRDGKIVVYSPICPHLGCAFQWIGDAKEFRCPCHISRFALDGKVLGGPAPRPLDRLPSKEENGTLWVIYKMFKPGVREQVEI